MWECGLKLELAPTIPELVTVTPYVGVWIETTDVSGRFDVSVSLLMWECGLKL